MIEVKPDWNFFMDTLISSEDDGKCFKTLRTMKNISINQTSKDLGLSKEYLKELESSKKVLGVKDESFKLKFDDEDLERIYYYYMKESKSIK